MKLKTYLLCKAWLPPSSARAAVFALLYILLLALPHLALANGGGDDDGHLPVTCQSLNANLTECINTHHICCGWCQNPI